MLELSPPAQAGFVARPRIFNPDGSEAELSGNGAREAILYLRRHGWTDEDTFAIETVAGPIVPTITGELTCAVDMGAAATSSKDFPSGGADGRGWRQPARRKRPRADGRRARTRSRSCGAPSPAHEGRVLLRRMNPIATPCGRLSYRREVVRGGSRRRSSGPPGTEEK